MGPWHSFEDWLNRRRRGPDWRPKGRPAPRRESVKDVHPALEQLEVRWLFDVNVWLPQRLDPLDGTTQANPASPLFRPATTGLLSQLGLQSTVVSASGNFSLTDNGHYSLSLTQSGPDGGNTFYSFTESGPVTFNLTELGSFTAAGFSTTSVTLTETASVSWSFLVTDDNGHTLSYQSGSNTFTAQGSGAAPFDPYFAPGFNWLSVTQQVSSLNTLNLSGLSATSLSVGETSGSDTFIFQETSGVATVQGNVRVPLGGSLFQSGQDSYSDTAAEQFNGTQSGSDSFALTELGQYAANSYSLSSVAYSETGTQSSQFNATLTDAPVSATGSASGAQSFSGNNHALGGSAAESFSFTGLGTTNYGETSTSAFTLTESGTYGGGSFSLASLNYAANGSGGYTLTQTSLQSTQNGTFSDSGNASGTDSFGVAGALTDAGTATESGNFTATDSGTLHDSETGNFTLTELGAYGNASWSLSSFNLTESLAGTFSLQQLDTLTEKGTGTATDSGTGTDSFLLNYGTAVSDNAGDTVNSTGTVTDTLTLTGTDSRTESGNSSYTLALLGALTGGSPSLSCYVFTSGQSGTFTATDTTNSTDTGNAQDTVSGSDSATHSTSYGGVSANLPGNDHFSGGDSFSFTSTDSASANESGSFGQSVYQAGVFNHGSWSLTSVSLTSTGSDTWSASGFDTVTDSGTASSGGGANGTSTGTVLYGGGSFTGLGGGGFGEGSADTFSDTATDSFSSAGSSQFTLTEQGTYGGYSFGFAVVVYQANGTSAGTAVESSYDSFAGNESGNYSGNGTTTATGSYGIHTNSGLGTSADSGTDSLGFSGHDTLTETVTSGDSWNVYEKGSFLGGLWALSSVSYGESFSDSFSSQDYGSATDSGTDTFYSAGSVSGSQTTVYGGGSVTGPGTVVASDQGHDTVSDSSNDTVTASGTDTFLLTESGSFSNFSFAFGSLVYQGGDSVSQTVVLSSHHTATGVETGSSSDSGQGNSAGSYAASTDSGTDSFTISSSESFQTGGNDSFGETLTSTDCVTFYQAGQWSGGSLSLSSLSSTETIHDTWSFLGGDTATDNGPVTQSVNVAGNGTALAGSVGTSTDTGTAGDQLAGSAADTLSDGFSGGGNDSWSVVERGTFGNFSASYGTLIYSGSGNQTATRTDSAADSVTGTRTDTGGPAGTYSRGGPFGLVGVGLQATGTANASNSLSETANDSQSATESTADTWTFYQAGSFSGNSLSLSSFAFSDTGADSWSDNGNDTVSDAGGETLGAGATFGASAAVGSYAGLSFSLGGTVGFSGSVGGTDTAAGYDSFSDTGGDTWSVTEQGVYANYSYGLACVVLQGGGTFSGTAQESSDDSFVGSDTVNFSDGSQQNSTTTLSLDLEGAFANFAVSGTLTPAVRNYAHGSLTDTGGGSYGYYEGGSFAGDSFAFASVSYRSGGSDSYTATETSSAYETLGGSGGATDSTGSNGSSGNNVPSPTRSAAYTVTESDTYAGNDTATGSQTVTGGDSFSLTEQGSFAAGSYGLSCYVYSANDSNNRNAVETDTGTDTVTSNGSYFYNGFLNEAATVGTTVFYSVSATNSATDSGSFSGTASSTGTATRTELSTFVESLYQAGSFALGSFAFASFVYSQSSYDSATTTGSDTYTSTDTRSGQATDSGGESQVEGYRAAWGTQVYTAQDTVTGGDTQTDSSASTQVLYQSGGYANESYGLGSFALLEQSAQTHGSTQTNNASSAESGASTGEEDFSLVWYQGSGNFSTGSGSNGTAQGTVSESFSLTEQGTFASGSYGLSCYAYSQQQQSSDTASSSGSWTETFSGTNQGQGYSGGGTGSFSGSGTDSAAASLTEVGAYSAAGSFSLGLVSFAAAGGNSFGSAESDSSSWTGGYSGTESASASASGNGSYSESALGSFINGSFSLTADVLQGGATGSFSSSEGEYATLSISSGGCLTAAGQRQRSRGLRVGPSGGGGGGPMTVRYLTATSGYLNDTLNQSETETAGSFSPAGYGYTVGGNTQRTDQYTDPSGAQLSDGWGTNESIARTGSGGGSETDTDSDSLTWGGGGSAGSGGQASPQFTVPQAGVQLAAPDPTSVPTAGEGQPGTPPSGSGDLPSQVGETGGMLTGEEASGAQAAEPSSQLVAARTAGTGQSATGTGSPQGPLPTSDTGGWAAWARSGAGSQDAAQAQQPTGDTSSSGGISPRLARKVLRSQSGPGQVTSQEPSPGQAPPPSSSSPADRYSGINRGGSCLRQPEPKLFDPNILDLKAQKERDQLLLKLMEEVKKRRSATASRPAPYPEVMYASTGELPAPPGSAAAERQAFLQRQAYYKSIKDNGGSEWDVWVAMFKLHGNSEFGPEGKFWNHVPPAGPALRGNPAQARRSGPRPLRSNAVPVVGATPADMRNPKPNTLYETSGYHYRTDAQGRLVEVTGNLRRGEQTPRNKNQQTVRAHGLTWPGAHLPAMSAA
jgi:hypothetical protein